MNKNKAHYHSINVNCAWTNVYGKPKVTKITESTHNLSDPVSKSMVGRRGHQSQNLLANQNHSNS